MLSTHDKMQTGTPDAAGLLRQWQTRMLDGLLIVLSIVGLLAAIGGSWSDYNVYGASDSGIVQGTRRCHCNRNFTGVVWYCRMALH